MATPDLTPTSCDPWTGGEQEEVGTPADLRTVRVLFFTHDMFVRAAVEYFAYSVSFCIVFVAASIASYLSALYQIPKEELADDYLLVVPEHDSPFKELFTDNKQRQVRIVVASCTYLFNPILDLSPLLILCISQVNCV